MSAARSRRAGEELELRRRDLLLCALLVCSSALPGASVPAAAGHGGDAPGGPGATPTAGAAAAVGQPAATVAPLPTAAAVVSADPPVATVSAVPPDTDLLLALPPAGVAAGTLAEALAHRGYEPLPALPLLPAVRVRVPAGADPEQLARALAATGLLAAVEPDAHVRAGRLPDDPLLVTQQAYLEAVRAPAAWEVATGSEHVLVAVVDSGIDATHADLATRLFVNQAERPDGRDDDGNGCADDTFGCTFVSPEAADP